MDVFAEQSILNTEIDKHKKRTIIIKALCYFCIGTMVIISLLFVYAILMSSVGEMFGFANFGYTFLFFFILVIPFVIMFILLRRFKINTNIEYDYYLDGNIFRVVQVIERVRRKKLYEFKISGIASAGRVTAESYSRISANYNGKQLTAYCSADSDDDIIYIYFKQDGENKMLFITPDYEMIKALRTAISNNAICDKSLAIKTKVGDE